jgi:hypothetical protein
VTSRDITAAALPGEFPDQRGEPLSYDASIAHPARTYDYWLGGKDNYEADREAGDIVIATMPSILPTVRANRAFLRRAVEYLAREAGIRQFLDIGTGLPTADNTHEVAQQIAPESRIVYVDNDPIVLAHSRALLTSTPQGATAYIQADARDPAAILREAAETLDFSQPVAVMMLAIMHLIADPLPEEIAAAIVDALAPGSYLTITAATRDIDTERMTRAAGQFNTHRVAVQFHPRTHAEISRYFTGLELIEPGLVSLAQWRATPSPDVGQIPWYGGMGRKGTAPAG